MTININVILPSDNVIKTNVEKILRDSLNGTISRAATHIQKRLRILIGQAITDSQEYQSLTVGRLYHAVGVPDVKNRLNSIIDTWSESLVVIPKLVRFTSGGIKGGLNIKGVDITWKDVLSEADATFVTTKGALLPWLDWLLIQGTKIIVKDYDVVFKRSRFSRTGRGLMIKTNSHFTDGKNFKIPAEFAGTPRNNFVTRALAGVEAQVEGIITTEVLRQVR